MQRGGALCRGYLLYGTRRRQAIRLQLPPRLCPTGFFILNDAGHGRTEVDQYYLVKALQSIWPADTSESRMERTQHMTRLPTHNMAD